MVSDTLPPPQVQFTDLIQLLESSVQSLCRRHVKALAEVGVQVKVVSTLRTWAEQDRLYRQGRSEPGSIVTYARGGGSWHNFGRAYDLASFETEGGVRTEWAIVGRIGEQLGLEWGGRWKMGDTSDISSSQGE